MLRRGARCRARFLATAAILGGVGLLREARADGAPIVPPRLEASKPMAYPHGASGDATVILILTVEKDGTVSSVEVASGAEPFASAAKETARAFRYAPATRADKPIAAKIRVEATFIGPRGKEAPPPPRVQLPESPAASTPLEVTVYGEKPPPSVSSLTRTEVRQIPGTFGDPFRAIETLPGVTPIATGVPYFYVRGSPPGNVGYFLDGVRIPYLFHVAVGPSVINPAMVGKVDLYSGGYPAGFGRYAGAIVAAETTAPSDHSHGEGNLRLFDAGAMVEGTFANGRGTALIGGRYSYTGALFSLLSPTNKLDYRDYQARVTFDITPRDRIGLFAFGSYDLLEEVNNGVPSILFGSEFYRVDARYDHKLSGSGFLRVAATFGFEQTHFYEQRNARDLLVGTRFELFTPIHPALTVHAGADAQFDGYSANKLLFADPDDPSTKTFNALFPPRNDTALGAYADVAWKMSSRATVTPGVRLDMFRSGGASALSADGRLSLNVEVNRHVRLLHAVGMAHQPPSYIIPLPGLALATLEDGLQSSVQSSAGVEVDWPEVATATVTFFDNVLLNMSDSMSIQPPMANTGTTLSLTPVRPRSLGSAFGMEVYVRRRLTQKLGGFLSYTLSRSTRALGRETFPSAFDRTHVFNAALAYDLGRGFRAGGRFTLYTGAPTLASIWTHSQDPARDPTFYRIDLRAEKRWSLGGSRWLSLVLEGMNVTVQKEVVSGKEIGPIAIPSIGLEGGFG